MSDFLQDWLGAVALAAASALGVWLSALSDRINRHETQIAVLVSRVDDMPRLLAEIRDEIRALRRESEQRAVALYEHMDEMRLETKDDLATKADKAAR